MTTIFSPKELGAISGRMLGALHLAPEQERWDLLQDWAETLGDEQQAHLVGIAVMQVLGSLDAVARSGARTRFQLDQHFDAVRSRTKLPVNYVPPATRRL